MVLNCGCGCGRGCGCVVLRKNAAVAVRYQIAVAGWSATAILRPILRLRTAIWNHGLNYSDIIFISMCKLTRTIQWAWNSFNLLMSTIWKFEGERSKRSATYEKFPKCGVWGGISPVYMLVFWFQQLILMKEDHNVDIDTPTSSAWMASLSWPATCPSIFENKPWANKKKFRLYFVLYKKI